jgi:hypothetical protein
LRHSLALRIDLKVETDISGPGPQVHSVQNPLEMSISLHLQVWIAVAGLLAAIATDAATAAAINVKDSNRMCRSHLLAIARHAMMSPRRNPAKRMVERSGMRAAHR